MKHLILTITVLLGLPGAFANETSAEAPSSVLARWTLAPDARKVSTAGMTFSAQLDRRDLAHIHPEAMAARFGPPTDGLWTFYRDVDFAKAERYPGFRAAPEHNAGRIICAISDMGGAVDMRFVLLTLDANHTHAAATLVRALMAAMPAEPLPTVRAITP